jgi:hypothetical protein
MSNRTLTGGGTAFAKQLCLRNIVGHSGAASAIDHDFEPVLVAMPDQRYKVFHLDRIFGGAKRALDMVDEATELSTWVAASITFDLSIVCKPDTVFMKGEIAHGILEIA